MVKKRKKEVELKKVILKPIRLKSAKYKDVKKFAGETAQRISTLTKRKLAQRAVSRRVLKKPGRATVVIKQDEGEMILHDPNRFFRDEWEEAKGSLYFK